MKNVAVFFGGKSVEHDISVITGVTALNALDKSRFCGIPIYVHSDGFWYTGEGLYELDEYKRLNVDKLLRVTLVCGDNRIYLLKGKKLKSSSVISIAINCMHGERGEDGSLAGLLNMCNIPLASPGIMPSAVCMDKCFTKTVMKGLKIKTLPYFFADSVLDVDKIKAKLKFPVIVKPASLGSSIGIRIAENEGEIESALSYALKFGSRAIIEPCLKDFLEINCAVYKDQDGKVNVSECEMPIGRTKMLTFKDKYKSGQRVFPADIDKEISDKIKAISEKVYNELCFDGVIRIDYFVSKDNVYLNEVNTVPGSLAYYLFGKTLKDFSDMLTKMLIYAERQSAKQSTVITTYDSGIFCLKGAKGAKGKTDGR